MRRRFNTIIRAAIERRRSRGRVSIGTGTYFELGSSLRLDDKGGRIIIGNDCRLCTGCLLQPHGGVITLGNNVSINPYTVIYGHGGVTIGNNVRIATHTVIIPANHVFDDPETPIRKQGLTKIGIRIDDDVWIGANAVILDGSRIGRGCVIGAGSVVRGELEPMGVYVGTPARRIRERGHADPSLMS